MFTDTFQKLLGRPAQSQKYDFGHVLVIGGSSGMEGAPLLAATAALRSGAGLVTIAAPEAVRALLAARQPELMTVAITSDEALQSFISERRVSTVVIGPGLQPTVDLRHTVHWLTHNTGINLVIDGGALGALQSHVDVLQQARCRALVLTPHLGEFQKLYAPQLPVERESLKPIAAKFAADNQVILVLKGNPTFVAGPKQTLYENPTGNPGMATAGSGDVLAGVIGGLLGQMEDALLAATSAVYIHGLAGDVAAQECTEPGMIASDIIAQLAPALQQAAK